MEIIICEANELKRQEYEKFISGYVMMEELRMRVVLTTGDPKEVLEYVKDRPETRLYVLDIDLQSEKNGIDLAYEIRKYDSDGPIVYITNCIELMGLTFEYGVAALGFIIKSDPDLIRERLAHYLNLINERYLNQEGLRREFFAYKEGFNIARVDVSDILFFQVASKGEKRIEMYTKNGIKEFYGKITEIEKKNRRFLRCHRSCVVNLDNIMTINVKTGKIAMVTGDVCYASINGLRNLRKILNIK